MDTNYPNMHENKEREDKQISRHTSKNHSKSHIYKVERQIPRDSFHTRVPFFLHCLGTFMLKGCTVSFAFDGSSKSWKYAASTSVVATRTTPQEKNNIEQKLQNGGYLLLTGLTAPSKAFSIEVLSLLWNYPDSSFGQINPGVGIA